MNGLTLSSVALSICLAPRLSHASPAQEPKPNTYIGANYGIGVNLWPNTDSGETPLVSDLGLTLGIGLPGDTPGFLVEFEIAGLIGHNERTNSDLLVGASLRVAPWPHSFFRLRSAVQLRNDTPRTKLIGLYTGLSSVKETWLSNIEVGWILGEHRDNGYINLLELRVGFSRMLGKGK